MENLPEEVRRRIEENRAKALAIKKQKEAERLRAEQAAAASKRVVEPSAAGTSVHPKTTTQSVASFFGQNKSSVQKPSAVGAAGGGGQKYVPGHASTSAPHGGFHGRGGGGSGHSNNSNTRNIGSHYGNNVYNTKPKSSSGGVGTATSSATAPRVTGICILISGSEFRLQCGYNPKLNDVMKTFPGARYDISSRHFCFRVETMENLLKAIREGAPDVAITGLPSFIPKVLRSNIRLPVEDVELSSIDPKLRKALMPFQVEGVLRGIAQRGRVLIADDMGLGKTIQAMAIATYFREEWPLFVVCPSSMRFAWRDSFLRWLPSLTDHDIQVVVKSADPLGANQILICSYDLMARRSEDLIAAKFKVLIFDESHFLKGYKTQRTKVGIELSANARRIILLSGTPALSRPIELYPQIQCLAVRHWPNVHDFALRYCNARETKFGWDFSGSSYLEELNILLQEVIMIRRLKRDVLDQLPAKQRNVILLDPTLVKEQDKQASHLSQMVNNDQLSTMERRGVLMQYFAKSADLKMKAVCKYVEEILEGDCKFLVFAHHTVMLDAVSELLKKKKVDYIRIDGKVGSEARQRFVEQFQTDTNCRVAVLSITAANSGITLHTANIVIFAELFWNPGILTQAEDRIHRIGQMNTCVIQYLMARGTSDDYIWPLIEQKLSVLNQVGLSKDTFSDAMDRVSEQVVDETDESDDETASKSEDGNLKHGGPPRKRQKTIMDFMSTTADSFWEELTQENSTILEEF